MPWRKADVGFFPVGPLANAVPSTTHLSLHEENPDLLHLHLEQGLDRGSNLRLAGITRDTKHDLVSRLGNIGCLFGNMRGQQDLVYPFRIHASTSSNFFTAGTVINT